MSKKKGHETFSLYSVFVCVPVSCAAFYMSVFLSACLSLVQLLYSVFLSACLSPVQLFILRVCLRACLLYSFLYSVFLSLVQHVTKPLDMIFKIAKLVTFMKHFVVISTFVPCILILSKLYLFTNCCTSELS